MGERKGGTEGWREGGREGGVEADGRSNPDIIF